MSYTQPSPGRIAAGPRLVLRVPPPADISNAGYLYRMVQHNGYEDVKVLKDALLKHEVAINWPTSTLFMPTSADALSWIARLLWLKPQELYQMTWHPWASVLKPLGSRNDTIVLANTDLPVLSTRSHIKRHLHTESQAQCCPVCLGEDAYHRRPWYLRVLTVCPQHHQLLIDRCTTCNNLLDIASIAEGTCRHCAADLRVIDTHEPPGHTDKREWQAMLFALIDGAIDVTPLVTQYQWPETTPQIAYDLLATLWRIVEESPKAQILDEKQQDAERWPYLAGQMRSYLQVMTAFDGLCNWPMGFHEVLRTYGGDNYSLRQDFGPILRKLERQWREPETEFIQQAFNSLIVQQYSLSFSIRRTNRYQETPGLAEQFTHITYPEASKILKIPAQAIANLALLGKLKRFSAVDERHFLFERAEVMALDSAWTRKQSLAAWAEELGVSHRTMRDYIIIGYIEGVSIEKAERELNERHIDALVAFLIARACEVAYKPSYHDTRPVDLTARQLLPEMDYADAALVVSMFRQGRLGYTQGPHDMYAGTTLQFTDKATQAAILRARQEHDLVDTAEIAAQVQVPVAEVISWIAYGLLPEEARVGAGALFYRRQDVMTFIANHMTGPQVTELLDLSDEALHKLVEEGQLVALSGLYGGLLGDIYLFRRQVIEQWMRAKSD